MIANGYGGIDVHRHAWHLSLPPKPLALTGCNRRGSCEDHQRQRRAMPMPRQALTGRLLRAAQQQPVLQQPGQLLRAVQLQPGQQ